MSGTQCVLCRANGPRVSSRDWNGDDVVVEAGATQTVQKPRGFRHLEHRPVRLKPTPTDNVCRVKAE